MKINIQSPHFTLYKKLTALIIEKTNRLTKFNERIITAEVCLKLDKSGKDDNKVCEIRLIAPEKNLFASRKRLTFEDAVTHTVKALEHQIVKKKTQREGNNDELSIEELEEEELE
jgi:putative sigma-54 modulation protein